MLEQKKSKESPTPSHEQLMSDTFNINPLECTLIESSNMYFEISKY